jgi:hypothetical protein
MWKTLLLAAVIALGLCAAALAEGSPGLLTAQDGSFGVRPATIVYTGDGTGIIGRLGKGSKAKGGIDWELWGPLVAYGVGTVWLDDCTPDCADGTFHEHGVRVLADAPAGGRFTRLTLLIRFGSHTATDIRDLRRVGSAHEWGIVSQNGFPG